VTLYRATGCPSCSHTGYRGRKGIFELMTIDDEIRALLSRNVDSKTIKAAATAKGMGTLRADGARKVLTGVTSVAEVIRATEEEGSASQV
jgi:type II secretory ATPase GspE/PulE/Tfp pilus assembly ATPase PilB-like protein